MKISFKRAMFYLGLLTAFKFLFKILAFKIVKPIIKRFLRLFHRTVSITKGDRSKLVIIYGATTSVGKMVSKIIALKFNYSVLLVD